MGRGDLAREDRAGIQRLNRELISAPVSHARIIDRSGAIGSLAFR